MTYDSVSKLTSGGVHRRSSHHIRLPPISSLPFETLEIIPGFWKAEPLPIIPDSGDEAKRACLQANLR